MDAYVVVLTKRRGSIRLFSSAARSFAIAVIRLSPLCCGTVFIYLLLRKNTTSNVTLMIVLAFITTNGYDQRHMDEEHSIETSLYRHLYSSEQCNKR